MTAAHKFLGAGPEIRKQLLSFPLTSCAVDGQDGFFVNFHKLPSSQCASKYARAQWNEHRASIQTCAHQSPACGQLQGAKSSINASKSSKKPLDW